MLWDLLVALDQSGLSTGVLDDRVHAVGAAREAKSYDGQNHTVVYGDCDRDRRP